MGGKRYERHIEKVIIHDETSKFWTEERSRMDTNIAGAFHRMLCK